MYDHCYCMRLPGNSEVSLAVMTLPAADIWVQGLEAQIAKCVVPVIPLYLLKCKTNLVLTYVRSTRVCAWSSKPDHSGSGPCRSKLRPALPNCRVRYVVFWDIVQHRVVILYQVFQVSLSVLSSSVKKPKGKNRAGLKSTDTIFFFGTLSIL